MKLNLLDAHLFGAAAFEAGENLGRAESDRGILMIAYSRAVLEEAKCIGGDGLPSAPLFAVAKANGELKRAKAQIGAAVVPGDSRTWDQRFMSDSRIVGLYGALMEGLLENFIPDTDGEITIESSVMLRKSWQAAKNDAWKMVAGKPKGVEVETGGDVGGGGDPNDGPSAPATGPVDNAGKVRELLRQAAGMVTPEELAACMADVFASDFLVTCAALAESAENIVVVDVTPDAPRELTVQAAAI